MPGVWRILQFAGPAGYLFLVLLGLVNGLDPQVIENFRWASVLTVITLPWSSVIVLIWIFTHGEVFDFFGVAFFVAALINLILMFFFFRRMANR